MEETEAPVAQNLQSNPFLITDEEISQLSPQLSYISQDFDNRFRRSIFHKYFLNSIDKVKEDNSRKALLVKLQAELDTGIYHFPISDIDELYACIFDFLPTTELFQKNTDLMNELFLIMNIFMYRFYDLAFPFFYNHTIEGNIFTYGPLFVVHYFKQFSVRFHIKSVASDKPYLNLLMEDGSLTNILNYLFEQYTKGFELELSSDCIYQLMRWLDCHFLRDYLQQTKSFNLGTSIFYNSNLGIAYKLNFPIAFYLNYFENNHERVSTPFLKVCYQTKLSREEEDEKKDEIAQNILNDINDLQVYQYIESYLSVYINQLINEGRLINMENPFTSSLNDVKELYPPQAEDKYINYLLDLLLLMFRFIDIDRLPNCIFDFIPLISAIFKVIPGVFLSDWYKWTTFLFDKSREYNTEAFELLKSAFLETIQCRLYNNFHLNINCQEMLKMLTVKYHKLSGPEEIIQEINRISISSFVQILFFQIPRKEPFIDPNEFFARIKFSSLDSIREWFIILMKKMKHDKMQPVLSKITLLEYGNVSNEPDFIECFLDLFRISNFSDDDKKELNNKGVLPYYFDLFMKSPNLADLILPAKIFSFCESIGKYIIDNRGLIGETENIAIESGDIFKIKLFTTVINSGDKNYYNQFTDRVVQSIIAKLITGTPGMPDEQLVQQIISVTHFLVTIDFSGNETMLDILRSAFNYLVKADTEQANLISIDEYHDKLENSIKFENSYDQAKANIAYALTNSIGFGAISQYIGLIDYFLNEKYGMCIEVLNFISNIIGFLIKSLGNENAATDIQTTNTVIFKIMEILIGNTPETSINFNLQEFIENQDQIHILEATVNNPENMEHHGPIDPEIEEEIKKRKKEFKKYEFDKSIEKMKRHHSKNKEFIPKGYILKFALHPIGYEFKRSVRKDFDSHHREPIDHRSDEFQRPDDFSEKFRDFNEEEDMIERDPGNPQIVQNCFYSCTMNGQKIDDTFGFAINDFRQSNPKIFRPNYIFTVNTFVRNITNYIVHLLVMGIIKPETSVVFKQTLMLAFKNGLIQVPTLHQFFQFVMDPMINFFTSDEEVGCWINGAVERASYLMISSSPSEANESARLEIGSKRDQLKEILFFMYNMTNNIYHGCLSEELIEIMFKYSSLKKDDFMNFIFSDESSMEFALNQFLAH